MKRIVFPGLIAVLLFFYQAVAAQQQAYRLLQSNLISGLIPDIEDAYGVSFLDVNQDRYPDIYITCFRNLNRLLINNGGIIPFIDRTIYSGLGGDLMQKGRSNLELAASFADYDNDGLPDLFLAGWGKTFRLFRNLGHVRFSDQTASLNLHGVVDANQGIWFDANNDGYLDLYITDEHNSNRFLVNQKNGTFKEQIWSEELLDSATSQGAFAADFDQDGDMDIYVCNWFTGDYFLLNDGRGLFSLARLPLPTLEKPYNSNSASAADLDNDGDLDLLVATRDGYLFYYRNQSRDHELFFVSDTLQPFFRIGQPVYGVLCADFNNDSYLDLFIAVNGQNRLYINQGRGRFLAEYDSDHHQNYSTGSAVADFDRDGDLDLLVGNKKSFSQIYLNPVNDHRSVTLSLIGVKSNRQAIGARVFLSAQRGEQTISLGQRLVTWQAGYFSSQAAVLHVGSGPFTTLEARIYFPSGRLVELDDLQPGHNYVVYEYPPTLARLLLLTRRTVFFLKQKQTWYTLGLIVLLILILITYTQLSLRRYHFSPTVLTFQFILWFTVAVVLFVGLYQKPIYMPLMALNAFSLLSLLTTFLFSERQRRRRLEHEQFRQALQNLSQGMLQIHDEKELFEKVIAVLKTNRELNHVRIFRRKGQEHFLVFPQNKVLKLNFKFAAGIQILKEPYLFQENGRAIPFNVWVPISIGQQHLALLAFYMMHPNHPIARQDLQMIYQIANQMAITLENIYYIEHTARLTRQVTEARLKEKYLKRLEETNRQLDEKNKELTRLFKELQSKEAQLIHSEKMAALGQLVAGITHEINNPVSFIYANSRALQTLLQEIEKVWQEMPDTLRSRYGARLAEIFSDIRGIITDNLTGSQAIKDLVLQLKNFSRIDQAEWKETFVVEGLETALRLVRHQIKDHIEVRKKFLANPKIYCNPAQLNQVFVNLLLNAIQAIEERGTITMASRLNNGRLEILISDTGKGIPEDVLPKIFDPFFTTKEINQGTGLGLSISYSIIQKHNGTIDVKSKPGQGTTFIIRLPLQKREQDGKADRTSEA